MFIKASLMSARFFVRGPYCIVAGVFYLSLGFALAIPEQAVAQIPPAQREAMVAVSRSSRETLDPQRFPDREQAEQRLLSAVEEVTRYLGARTNEENLARWMEYIGSDPLVEAIRSGAPTEEIASHARRVRGRLIGDIDGLELRPMTQLRRRTEELAASLRFDDSEAAVRLVEQQLEALARRLENADDLTSAEDAAAISTIIGLLHESNQVPQVIQSVRSAFSKPNIIVTIHGDVIERAISRDISQIRPVRDCILGTTVIGTAALNGHIQGRLVPCHGKVRIDLILTGQLNSNTTGYNGPVRLPTVGRGFVTATRSICIDEMERQLTPTFASASLKSTVTSIEHPRRIVRRIAQRQVDKKQPQAERIARERFRTQVAADFDRQTAEAVRGGGGGPLALAGGATPLGTTDPVQQARTTLARLNLNEPARLIGSTAQSIYVHATQRADAQLASATWPPSLADLLQSAEREVANQPTNVSRTSAVHSPFMAAIQVHESVVDNAAARILAGRTMTGKQMDRLLALGAPKQNTLLALAEKLQAVTEPPAEQEPFEIDFASFRPVILELRDQTVRIGIRGTRFSQGNRELIRPLEITAVYQPERAEDGSMLLRRTGTVGVDFPGTRRLNVQQVALRRTIQRTFADRFPETLLDRPLVMPLVGGQSLFTVSVFKTALIDARDGWATITIKQ
jgi:hypothetical protein